jgi:ParB-like chromosome segregation protein Spo0J
MPVLEVHEIATIFPSMSEVDLAHLRESIQKQGQLEEILVYEGKILDGRHRYEACLALDLEPRLREFQGTLQEAFSHSVALNLSRRHLTTVQRAAAGAGITELQARLLAAQAPAPPEEPEPAAPVVAPAEVEIDVSIDETPAPAPAPAPAAQPAPREGKIRAKARALASQRVGVSGRAIDAAAKVKEAAPDVFERMLAGTAGSMPDVKRVTALPLEVRQQVHSLVDSGKNVRAALREVAPPAPRDEGAVFLGKVELEPEQARAFEAILEARGLRRAEAAREALLAWIEAHQGALTREPAGAPG